MWLITFLKQQSGPDPQCASRAWSVAAVVLPVAAFGLLFLSLRSGISSDPVIAGPAYASALVSCAAIACLTCVVPVWLGRFRFRHTQSKIVDLGLWAVPAAATSLWLIPLFALWRRAESLGTRVPSEAFTTGAVLQLLTIVVIGGGATCWGLAASVDRVLRRRGWRPPQEIAEEEHAERVRAVAESRRRIDRMLTQPSPLFGERAEIGAEITEETSPWHELVVTNRRLLLLDDSRWSWQWHADLQRVERSAQATVLTYRDQIYRFGPVEDGSFQELIGYLEGRATAWPRRAASSRDRPHRWRTT